MLKDLLTDIGMEVGKTSSDVDREARILRINKAAEEVHEMYDLQEGKDEKLFTFSVDDSSQLALPPYIFQVRGMRLHDGRNTIELEDARNRYNFQWFAENDLWYLRYRKKKESCLSRDIDNQSILKVSVPLVEAEEFKVTITGSTDNSYRVSETLTFAPGDLVKETVANFTSVESITKNIITKYNVIIKDVEDETLGMILNSEYQSYYNIYQIGDSEAFSLPEANSGVEVWFKYKMQPFKNDNDCFLGTSRYDKAIFWKFMEHRSKKVEDAVAFAEKCGQAIAATLVGSDAGQRKVINFKPQPLYEIYDYGYTWRY